jgi:HAE1 family hydrophobic/amphiphilic exporter-1
MAKSGSLNIISLSSLTIAIGLVVDDTIVVLENITKHIENGSTPKQAAIHGTNEVGVAVIASTLTIIAVFYPMTMATGIAGVMFGELGWMVTIMITVSLAAALSLTPMLCSQLLRLTTTQGKFFDKMYAPIGRSLDRLDAWYKKVVNLCVRNRWKTFLAALSTFVIIMVPGYLIVKTDFMPATDNNMITATVYLPTGTRMEVARATAMKIDAIIKEKYPEVKTRAFSVGQADEDNSFASMQTNGTNLISFRFRCIDADDRKRSIYDIGEGLREDLSNMPELYKYIVAPGGSGGMMGSGASTVDVEIYGYDLTLTDKIAAEFKTRLANVKGLKDLNISREDYRAEYQMDFDRDKLAEHGLNSATVATYVRNRINGSYTTKFREEGDEYDLVVRYAENHRQSLEDIENIMVYSPTTGQPIRIRELGTIVEKSTLPQIDRQNRQRVNKVQGSIYKAALSEVIEGVDKVVAEMREDGIIPPEIGISIGGSTVDAQESNEALGMLMILCVLLVYIVMAAQFESLTYPFIIILSILFGIAGVYLGLMVTGTTLSMMGMVGIIMLIGIVVKNGIVFIDYANLNRERGLSVDKAIIDAGRSRLRPILMTTATAVLGMIPMAIPRGAGSAMWQPLGVVVVFGLSFSTILTLIYVPALYSIFGSNGIRRSRKKYAKTIKI